MSGIRLTPSTEPGWYWIDYETNDRLGSEDSSVMLISELDMPLLIQRLVEHLEKNGRIANVR